MNEARFVPSCLARPEPRVEMHEGRRKVHPTLAGYPLKPGREYTLLVTIPGLSASDWELKCNGRPPLIDHVERGDSTTESHSLTIRTPGDPGGLIHSLKPAEAEINVLAVFSNCDTVPREMTVPVIIRPPMLTLLSLLAAALIPVSSGLNTYAQRATGPLEQWLNTRVSPLAVSLAVGVVLWLLATGAYLYWKTRRQPCRRAAELLRNMRSRLESARQATRHADAPATRSD